MPAKGGVEGGGRMDPVTGIRNRTNRNGECSTAPTQQNTAALAKQNPRSAPFAFAARPLKA